MPSLSRAPKFRQQLLVLVTYGAFCLHPRVDPSRLLCAPHYPLPFPFFVTPPTTLWACIHSHSGTTAEARSAEEAPFLSEEEDVAEVEDDGETSAGPQAKRAKKGEGAGKASGGARGKRKGRR